MPGITATFVHEDHGAIELECLGMEVLSSVPIMDGLTYVASEMTVKLRLVYNPSQNSWMIPAVGAFPVQLPNQTPVTTHPSLRFWLSINRPTTFSLNWGGQNLIFSPLVPNGKWDTMGGPECDEITIREATGSTTQFITLTMKVRMNESILFHEDPSVLLSLNWRTQMKLAGGEGGYFAVLSTDGHAIFDMAKLEALNREVGDYEQYINFPVKNGYRRVSSEYATDEKRNVLHFRFIDAEQPYSILLPNITLIDAALTRTDTDMGWEARGWSIHDAVVAGGLGSKIAKGAAGFLRHIPLIGLAPTLAGAGIDALVAGVRTLPTSNMRLTASIYGNYKATRRELVQAAKKFFEFVDVNFDPVFEGTTVSITDHLTDRRVDLIVEKIGGPIGTLVGGGDEIFTGMAAIPEDVPGLLSRNPTTKTQPPDLNGTRSRDHRVLATPPLHDAGAGTAPPKPKVARDVIPTLP